MIALRTPTPLPYDDATVRLAQETLRANRVAIFIVAYNAERHIERVLERIPTWVADQVAEIYIIDDSSKDGTVRHAVDSNWAALHPRLKVFKTPFNQGYGGNQRLGYQYAIERGFDIVVLLHGDGQYAPESLPHVLAEYSQADGADAVYGSRFMIPGAALRGGMPLYKFVGNRILTTLQNRIIGTELSEMHSGYRSYRVAALKRVPFSANSRGFDFDSDIIIQFAAANLTIREVAIPTFYGDEICHVNGVKYAWACIKAACQYRLMQLEIFYNPKFDIAGARRSAGSPNPPSGLHRYIQSVAVPSESRILQVVTGDEVPVRLTTEANDGSMTVVLESRVLDCFPSTAEAAASSRATSDPDDKLPAPLTDARFTMAFVLDGLEHLKSPEAAADRLFRSLAPGGKLYASTGNIGFWVTRIMHLFGQFNYSRRGILDLTHTRLFTRSSFCRLLRNAGFQIDVVRSFGPPLAKLGEKESRLLRWLDGTAGWLARRWSGPFAYQILVEATRPDSVDDLMGRTFVDRRQEGGRR